jgi:HlyD family secretion protein
MVRAVLGIAYLIGVAIAAGAIGVGPPRESLRVPPGEAISVHLPVPGEDRVAARALGKLESASEEIPVASDITGRIERIFVDEGDLVTAGQPLAQLEQTAYRARMEAGEAAVRAAHARWERLQSGARPEEIRKAQAQLAGAEARARFARERAERARQLLESGLLSRDEAEGALRESEALEAQVRAAREEYSIAQNGTRPEDLAAGKAELEKAERELAVARAELEKTLLSSPITGTVVRRNLRPGQAVSSFQVEPVVTVADLTRLRVRAEVDEIDIGKVHLGQRVRAEAEAFPGLLIEGRVVRLGRTMGRKTVKAQEPNERQDVRVREVLIDLDTTADLPLGLRLGVSFLE